MRRTVLFLSFVLGVAFFMVIACCDKPTIDSQISYNPADKTPVSVTGVSLNKALVKFEIGDMDTLTATVSPDNADDKTVIWESSDSDVVIVENGIITALSEGSAFIKVTTLDAGKTAECSVSVVKPVLTVLSMDAKRLPDLTYSRGDAVVCVCGGQLVVAGGHVEGFKTTNTAEYFDGESWNEITMNHAHDMGFSVLLRDGRLMIGGGCSSDLGVGHSSYVEVYSPESHSFVDYPQMKVSRTLIHAAEMADGNVFVSGNWYNTDVHEYYSAQSNEFITAGDVSVSRYLPYIFRSAENNAIVFSPATTGGNSSLIVDCFDGEPFTVDLFETWKPFVIPSNWRATDCAIGDYSYLIAAKNSNGEIGIIKIDSTAFSLLDLQLPIPTEYEETILQYSGVVYTDKAKKTAYLPAWNNNVNAPVYYVLKIYYGGAKGKLTLYKTDVLDAYASLSSMTMLPDGRMVACGGVYNSNFTPLSTVWAFSPF